MIPTGWVIDAWVWYLSFMHRSHASHVLKTLQSPHLSGKIGKKMQLTSHTAFKIKSESSQHGVVRKNTDLFSKLFQASWPIFVIKFAYSHVVVLSVF